MMYQPVYSRNLFGRWMFGKRVEKEYESRLPIRATSSQRGSPR